MSSASPISLRGMTWSHTRGYLPMVATAQRFSELHPEVQIVWEKRSLRDFEEFPIEVLATEYDLIVLDHPFVGYAAAHGPLLPLDEHLSSSFLADQAAQSVGLSHPSYTYGGHHWSLAIDAATPIAFWREDLAQELGCALPREWGDVIALAEQGRVEIPAAPINCLMNFYTFCLALGEEPFRNDREVVSHDVGAEALEQLRAVIDRCDPGCWFRNPIASHDRVASRENTSIVYCPLAYGYSNYARAGYADRLLAFGEPVQFRGAALRTTLGGTGLAVSSLRQHRAAALKYAEYVAAAQTQRTVYALAGGQPGHRSAWLDPLVNRVSNDYFARTLPALDRAYLRPRYNGYVEFQLKGSPIIHATLRRQLSDADGMSQLNALYRRTRNAHPAHA